MKTVMRSSLMDRGANRRCGTVSRGGKRVYKTERIYDLELLARQNLHIHTTYSPCAKPEMIAREIVNTAVRDHIRIIALTDHYNSKDFRILDTNLALKEQAEACGADIQVLYAAELSAYGVGKFLDAPEINEALDYRLYAYNHYHLDYWEHPEDKSPRGYVRHALEVLESLFATNRADCIAHPFIGRFIRCFDDKTLVTREIIDNELGDILEKGKRAQVAWELNVPAIFADPEFSKRYWRIGQEVGVTFNMGTDAHQLAAVGTSQHLDRLKRLLQ
ncbi:PHP domain-containing protein [Paenibacillus hemerocallicola]|uniref:PHP domain-containing protein n=1 Tax=Paenibacillus hemerocallicola TaxID=1172614 RepID=A0A5C4SY09_9BACL|nr:PHP domain-containing protein [Paenibacillus hemerocallicola]